MEVKFNRERGGLSLSVCNIEKIPATTYLIQQEFNLEVPFKKSQEQQKPVMWIVKK